MGNKKNFNNIPESKLNKVAAGLGTNETPAEKIQPEEGKNPQQFLPENALGEVNGGVDSSGAGPANGSEANRPRPMPLYGIRPPIMVKYGAPPPQGGKGEDKDGNESENKKSDNQIKPMD